MNQKQKNRILHPDFAFQRHGFTCAAPQVIYRNLKCNLAHYEKALWGIGLQLEGDFRTPKKRFWCPVALFWALLWVFALLTHSQKLLLALTLFWVSPFWTYVFAPLNDPIYEYRAYFSVAGWGLLLSFLLPGWIIYSLAGIWTVQSFRRSRFYRSNLEAWRQAAKENPVAIHPSRIHNPAALLWEAEEHENALAWFNHAVELYPDNRKLLLYRQGCAVDWMILKEQAKGKKT